MGDLFVCGQLFGNRLISEEKEKELRAWDAEVDWLMRCVDDLRTRIRLPAISVICNCKEGPRPAHPPSPSSSLSSSPSSSDIDSDDEEGLTLKQVLNAIDLYERKPLNKRSHKTLRNLISTFTGQQDIEDDQVKKILALSLSEDPGLAEVIMVLMKQLCVRENNAFKFLYHEGMNHNLDILSDRKLQYLHAGAAQVIGKLASHKAFGDLWVDQMLTAGLHVIISCLDHDVPQDIQYACSQALSSLATHRNLAILILDQASDAIHRFKNINSDFRDVYAELMTVLAQHTEHTRDSILNIQSLPEAVSMLKQGPCASQKHALTLFATLAEKDSGVKALIEAQTIQYTMSALIDSECRHVRCTALTVLHNLLSTEKVSLQKQVLLCVDHFTHGHEEGYSFLNQYSFTSHITRPGYTSDPQYKTNRAVEDLTGILIRQLHKEARMERDKKGGIHEVHLAPGIDTDPVHLQTLTHLTQVLTQVGYLCTLQLPTPTNTEVSKEERRNIIKQSLGGVNSSVVKVLVDRGVTALLDLLHVYVIKFNFLSRSVLPVTTGNDVTSPEQLKVVLQAWEECMKETKPTDVRLSGMFSQGEVSLIEALLNAALMLAKSTCDNDIKNAYMDMTNKMEDFDGKHKVKGCKTGVKDRGKFDGYSDKMVQNKPELNSKGESAQGEAAKVNNKCRCGKTSAIHLPESHVKDFMDKKATICCERQNYKEDPLDTISEAGLMFKESLNKELGGVRRLLRIKLYEAGIIECLGPWLVCSDKMIKETVLEALTCLVQPVPEYVQSRPVVMDNSNDKGRKRPFSAMTSEERDKALNMALHQMSSTSSSLIKDALGLEDSTPETPRKPITKLPSPQMFTIEENKHNTNRGRDGEERKTGELPKGGEQNEQSEITVASFEKAPSKPCQTIGLPKTEGVKENKNLKSYKHQDYERFARKPVRPQSAKPALTRPASAKMAAKMTRPQSAKIVRPRSASNAKQTIENAQMGSQNPSGDSVACVERSTRLTSGSSEGKVRENSAVSRVKMDVTAGTGDSGGPVHIKSIKPSSPHRKKQTHKKGKSEEAKSRKALEEITRKMRSGVEWKPTFDKCASLRHQCCMRVAEVAGLTLCRDMLHREPETKQMTLVYLLELVKQSETRVHMKLSEFGIVPRLVDYLRVHDNVEVLEVLGLILARSLVSSDSRLMDLFNHHGGTRLVMAMASYTHGFLRGEVTNTLKTLTRGIGSSTAVIGGRRRLYSAPVVSNKTKQQPPDIWDKVMARWKDEDKVTAILRKKLP